MIVAMCCTRNWYGFLKVELYALLKHNNVKKVYLFIEDDEIKGINAKCVEFVNVNKLPEYVIRTSPNYNTKYSKMSYLRCYFSKVLKEDKILYIDADAIAVDNIEDLWNTDFDDNVLIGVKEGGEWDTHLQTYGMNDNYINSGVLLMNLKALREEKLDDSMIELLNKRYYQFPDQDVINLICRNRIKYISNIYNSSETTGVVENAKIVHYIRERKGWIKSSPRSEIWYKYFYELCGGIIMEKYKVKVTRKFDDYEGKNIALGTPFTPRKVGDVFECSKERYEYLKSNYVVELMEVAPEISEEVEINDEPVDNVEKLSEEEVEEIKEEPVVEHIVAPKIEIVYTKEEKKSKKKK